MEKLLERFLNYARENTMSDEDSPTCPSTERQRVFARKLAEELKAIGLKEVSLDDNGYIMATLPSNKKEQTPVIGFIAHMDTSPEAPSEKVNPVIHHNYDGTDIVLNPSDDNILSVADFPDLKKYKGQTIITSDGTTLLGADDKAGIAEIVTAMEVLIANPAIAHGKIRIAFTPDEEIGRGADRFDIKKYGTEYAYTLDGGEIGELEYENFNAAQAIINIKGRNVHPGTAKGTMINAIHLAQKINSLLPPDEKPEFTSDYEGFFHLFEIKGAVEEASMKYIIRDHDAKRFLIRKQQIEEAVANVRSEYRRAVIDVNIKDQYFNMKEIIEKNYFIVENAIKAYNKAGIEPLIKPVRGGTDGARLSFEGLPCPNIFTGGHNYHGRFEFIPLESMRKAVEVIVNIACGD